MKLMLKIFLGVVLAGVILSVSGGYYVYSLLQPVDSQKMEKTRFTIPKGQSVIATGNSLYEKKLIKSPHIFRFVVWQQNLQTKIQAGSFLLSPDMSVTQIARELTKGTEDVWITVLEGWRAEEIADMLEAQELEDFDKEEFLNLATENEGYLYPDTYLIPKTATAETIFNILHDTFEKKVEKGLSSEIEKSGKDLKEVIIMASIVEREARDFKQMQSVAGVLWKRVDIGMALNADATLQYAHGYDKIQKTWWLPPTAADKEITSPFNSYKNPGLPPRPISNPGLDAIKATLDPEKAEYMYYIHDLEGDIHLAKTLEEHNQNVEKYLR